MYNKRHAHTRSMNTSTNVRDRITAVHSVNNHFSYGQLWLFNNTASLNEPRNAEWETIDAIFTDSSRLTHQLLSWRDGTVWIQPTCGLLYTYLPRSPAYFRTPKHWNLKGRTMTTSLLVLSASSIPSPPWSHCEIIPGMEKLGARFRIIYCKVWRE